MQQLVFIWKHLGALRKVLIAACLIMTKASDILGWLPNGIKRHTIWLIPCWAWQWWLVIAALLIAAFSMEESYVRQNHAPENVESPRKKIGLPIIVSVLILICWSINVGICHRNSTNSNSASESPTKENGGKSGIPTPALPPTIQETPKHVSKPPKSIAPRVQSTPAPAVKPLTPTQNYAPGGQAISGGTFYSPQFTNNNRNPIPPISWIPYSGLENYKEPDFATVMITVGDIFYNPAFTATCSVPCVFVMQYSANSRILVSNNRDTEPLAFQNPLTSGVSYRVSSMTMGTKIILIFRSRDGTPLSITDVKPYSQAPNETKPQ